MPRAPFAPPPTGLARRTLQRLAWQLLPVLGMLYVVADLDRINVGFAALHDWFPARERAGGSRAAGRA